MSKFLAVKACEWLSFFRSGGGMGKLNGGGKLTLKIKPLFNRKILRHEPLEDRHLLAVDLTNGFAGGMFPQEEMAVISAPQTSTQLAPAVAANVEDSAVIPADIIEREDGTTLHTELAVAFCGPMTWREWLESRGETDVQSHIARPMTAEESEQYVTIMAGLSGVGVLPGIDLDIMMAANAAAGVDPIVSIGLSKLEGRTDSLPDPILEHETVNSSGYFYYKFDVELIPGCIPELVDLHVYFQTENVASIQSSYLNSSGQETWYSVTDSRIGICPEITTIIRIKPSSMNNAIPHDETNDITFQMTSYLSKDFGADITYSGEHFFTGDELEEHTYTVATVEDDDNWVVGSSVIDAAAFEPASAEYINNNGGTADTLGIFRIQKFPGDDNCTDNTYPITVEFTLNDPVKYNTQDYPNLLLATYGSDYVVKVGNTNIPIVNGKGTVTIPAGQSYVDVIIQALDDNVADDNEQVCLDVTRAYSAQGLAAGKPFQLGWTGGYVLIKEVGWAVKSVIWQKHATGNDLIGKWTGLSVEADSDVQRNPNDPNSMNENFRKVNLIVTVEGLLPANGGTVTLVCLDPENASGTGAPNYDGVFPDVPLTFYRNQMVKTQTYIVGAHAGDNYLMRATANNGKPNNIAYSEKLTVWRRLWVECDQMAMPGLNIQGNNEEVYFNPNEKGPTKTWDDVEPVNEPETFDVRRQPDKPDISLLNTLLNQACVSAYEYTNNAKPVVDFVPNLLNSQMNYNNTLEIAQQGNNRSVPAPDQVDQFYWTMYVLAAYETDLDHDKRTQANIICPLFHNGNNSGNAYVFCETIRDVTHTHKNHPGATSTIVNYTTLFKRVIAHEILHSFLGGHVDPEEPSSPYISDQRIMNYEYIYTDWNCFLNVAQIAQIQFKPRPTPCGE